MGQCRPEKAGELAGDGGDDELFGFPADGEAPIAAVQPPLCVPRDVDRGGWGAALPPLQRGPQKRMMAILPGGFDEHTSEMRVASFGDRAARPFGAAGMLGRDEASKGHQARRGREPARVAEFGGNGQGGEIVDAAEAAQALDAGAS